MVAAVRASGPSGVRTDVDLDPAVLARQKQPHRHQHDHNRPQYRQVRYSVDVAVVIIRTHVVTGLVNRAIPIRFGTSAHLVGTNGLTDRCAMFGVTDELQPLNVPA